MTKLNLKYKPSFVRKLKKLPVAVMIEALKKIELFRDEANHEHLRVHKLKGKLKGVSSFSVTYSHRIIFEYIDDKTVRLIGIGDHDLYQ